MNIDIVIIVLFIALAIFGYFKGFIRGVINLIFSIAYLYFGNNITNFKIDNLDSNNLSSDIINNIIFKYVTLLIIGILMSLLVNMIISRFMKIGVASALDKIGGIIFHIVAGYLVICICSIVIVFFNQFVEPLDTYKDSFFLSRDFEAFNILSGWYPNVR